MILMDFRLFILLMAEIPFPTTWDVQCKYNGINYQPQLVIVGFLNHQAAVHWFELGCPIFFDFRLLVEPTPPLHKARGGSSFSCTGWSGVVVGLFFGRDWRGEKMNLRFTPKTRVSPTQGLGFRV